MRESFLRESGYRRHLFGRQQIVQNHFRLTTALVSNRQHSQPESQSPCILAAWSNVTLGGHLKTGQRTVSGTKLF